MSDPSKDPLLRVRHVAPAEDVPVYNCVVFVRSSENGVVARVANLPGIVVEAETERRALEKIVTDFKRQVRQYLQSGEPIPWSKAPQPEESEQQRFIGIHL